MKIACISCGIPFPDSGFPYKCPSCGGLYDDVKELRFDDIDQSQPGIWRYASSFEPRTDLVTLGEGNTPLLTAKAFGREVYLKCEYANPTGSFKDRGSATIVAALRSRRVTEAVEDSSGNAGASFAAYTARAGIKARVYAPESASGPKRKQIEIYGAQLILVPGPRWKAAEAALQAAEAGMVYASHAYLPFNLPGYATCAYEIVEQLGASPGAVIIPAGQGGFLLGMRRGFQAMQNANKINRMPQLIGVQSAACAPLFAFANGRKDYVTHDTLAEGVQVCNPLRKVQVVEEVLCDQGWFVSINETDIMWGRDALARLGFYVEPTSALIWSALEQTLPALSDPVVAVLTGSGYKVRI
jgi:threonine synthase